MKVFKNIIFALLVLDITVQAQSITQPGWFRPKKVVASAQPRSSFVPQVKSKTLVMPLTQISSPSVPVAEVITPQIQALADGLQDNPQSIFDYVHDNIKFVLYFGSKKGAQLTLLEGSGNDFDQSALLVALLRAAGYTNVQYQFGWQQIPYDDYSGNNYDLHHWWQLTLVNTNWTTTWNYLGDLALNRGYPTFDYYNDGNTFEIQRTWVALTIGTTIYQLDPAFKISIPASTVSGFTLTNAMGGTGTSLSNALMSAAAGTDNANYAASLNEAALRGKLTAYTTNLLNCLQNNAPNASVQDVFGGWIITPAYNPWDFSIYTTFQTDNFSGQMPILSWTYEPTNIMSTFNIAFAGTNFQCFMPQLQGQRLCLTFDGSGTAQLWQDDTLMAQHSTSGGSTTNVVLAVTHPVGTWDFTNNVFVYSTANQYNTITTNSYQRTNSTYAIMYAFEPNWGWLQQRQNHLDTYLQQGLTNGTRQVTCETLNIMGLNWLIQTAQTENMLAGQLGILPNYFHRFGRMAQETSKGYYVDVYMQLSGEYPSGGDDALHTQIGNVYFDLDSFFASTLEHGLIEQLQNTNLVGASTVKMLQIANANGQAVYLANSTNWSAIQGSLLNYGSTLTQIYNQFISQGYYVLLPANGSNHVSGTAGSWAGYGYEARQVIPGVSSDSQMIISGNYHGGYSSDPTIPIDPVFIDTSGDNQPTYFNPVPVSTPAPTSADPVDTANATFELDNTDLSVGQGEPRGISLSRYYNGVRRFSNPAGMSGGWIHNYAVNVATIAAPQAGLGGTTPAQAAAMFAATASAIATYNGITPNAKNWLTTALIAKWGVDQLTKNGASVNLGKATLQFIQQPNGVFTAPANSTATLTQSNSTYSLLLRHGNRLNFNAAGLLTSIADQYNQTLNLTYNASNWVNTVKDWKNRQFTFNYSGTPSRLTSVTDGTRTVNYGYANTYNSQGDLTSYTDAESKTSTYQYDTNHQITATLDAQSRLVVSNVYDSQNHLTRQYTQGDTNKTWRICWSGRLTSVFDPANGETDYYYDKQGRLVSVIDPIGYETDNYYDGQNHNIFNVSALNEVRQFVYDGNHNIVQAIDPLNCTNWFVYDNQNNLIKNIDPRGNLTTFGYNAQFSLTGQTNGAGDWVNFAFNADGTLHTRTDSGGTTTYDTYDAYGQLSHITYPGSLGGESFVISSLGDVNSHTDARGFVTSFKYNNRRQLTNTVAPTNVTMTMLYDAVGNAASTTDARNNTATNLWSSTRHLLATILPATTQGSPVVTNIYDNRDYLVKTLDPYLKATIYTNDMNGRTVSVTDPLNRTTSFSYDGDGRRLSTVNPGGEIASQTWDARGSLIQITDGAGHISTRLYDAIGNQIALTNRNAKKWQFQFDAANRVTNTVTPLGRSTSQTFNHQGLISSTKDPANQNTMLYYDAKGRLTNRSDNVASTYYGYDANDNRTSVIENGLTNSWAFDAYNHVSSYKDVFGNVLQYGFDANGNMTNLVYPGNKTVKYIYDSLNRLTNITDWSGRQTKISYDLAGRITQILRPNGSIRTVGYDVAGQATNIVEQMANGIPVALFRHNWTNTGTMAWEFVAPIPHTVTMPTRSMTYDDDNRLATVNGSSVTSDLNGNLTYAPLTNGIFTTHSFDARNRLTTIAGTGYTSPVTNTYDALNNRIAQNCGTNVTAFVVNPNAKLPQVLMRVKNGLTNYYIYGVGLMYQIAETTAATNFLTYHYDYRGSTVAIIDGSGTNVTDRIEYSVYGLTAYRAGSTDTPFLFSGCYGVQSDSDGLMYMHARYYNPYLCRFVSQDPSLFNGGLNWFAYAGGNPVSYIDPTGLNLGIPGTSIGYGSGPTPQNIVPSDMIATKPDPSAYFAKGALVGVGTAAAVTIASPLTVSGLVVAGLTEVTASAIVDAGLLVGGGTGVALNITDSFVNYQNGNWNAVAFNAGNLIGGATFGISGGGRYLADSVGEASGLGPSPAPNMNLANVWGYEWGKRYDPNFPGGDNLTWMGSAPTPFSGGFSATGIGSGILPATDLINQYGPSAFGALGSSSSSTGKH